MADGLQIWDEALSKFRDKLGSSEREKLNQLANFATLEGLLDHINCLQLQHSQRRSTVVFWKVKATFQWLWDFNASVQSFLQGSPHIFPLIWGSLSIILQISLNYTHGLELIADCLYAIAEVLPRANLYSTQLVQSSADILYGNLIDYHVELLGFCTDAAFFFKKGFYYNLLRPTWKSWQSLRLARIRSLVKTLDQVAIYTQGSCTLGIVKAIRSTQLESPEMFLGAVPYENLPRRNRSFFGRQKELDDISDYFCEPSSSNQGCKCASLYGLAGSGKSQVAQEYASRGFQNDLFQAVLWVSAETEIKLSESFATIAKGLGILDENSQRSHERQKQAVIQWLVRRSRQGLQGNKHLNWLVVFDNVSDPSVLDRYWPHAPGGSIIVTCRSPETAKQFSRKALRIESFDSRPACHFLLSTVGLGESHTSEDAHLASKVANAVGNHPLALNLVGSYIRCFGKSLEHFVRDHPDFERNLIFSHDVHSGLEESNQRSVSDAFALNCVTSGSRPLDQNSKLLMGMLAFLDPDGVPLELFRGHTQETMLCDGPDEMDCFPNLHQILDNPLDNVAVFDRVRGRLLNLALVSMGGNNKRIKCHRLVRIATERTMTTEEIGLALNKLVFFLNSAFPSQIDGQPLLSQWERCNEFASSVVAVLEACMRHLHLVNQPALLAEVVCRCSWYYYEQGQFNTATWMADQALTFCQKLLESNNHPGYTAWYVKDMISHQLNTKGAIGMKIPDADHGLSMYEKAHAIRVENRREGNAEDDMWIGAAMGNLGVSLMASGQAQDALPLLLELVQREDMKSNEDLYWSNLCLCLSLLGQYDDALMAGNMAEQCILRRWSKDDVRIASVMFYVSSVLEKQGNNAGALESLEMCLSIRLKAMRHHPETGLTMHRMGVFLSRIGRPKEAMQCLRLALETLRQCECHPGAICRTLLELGILHEQVGDRESSKEYFESAEVYRQQIVDVDTANFRGDPSEYDRFVTVGLR